MDVSVVIPAYNEEACIGKALKALRRQDFVGPRETIVVDNGSTDGTFEVVKKKFPEVQIFPEPDKGTNPARDTGWKKANGEFIAFLDADTVPPPWWLTRGVRHFEDPNVVAVAGSYSFYDGRVRDHVFAYLQRWYFFPLAKRVAEGSGGSLFFFANVFIRSSALKLINGLDRSITYHGDDADTAWRLAPHGEILYLPEFCVETSADRLKRNGLVKTMWTDYHSARAIAKKHQKRLVPSPV